MLLSCPLTLRRRLPCAARFRPHIEALETRCLLAVGTSGVTVLEHESNDTVDQAQPLGALEIVQPLAVSGQVGNSPAGAADVDFYSFTLANTSRVQVQAPASVLTLYDADPQAPGGYRLLQQDQAGPLERTLAAGTYYVAVSGQGNSLFNPLLADSGDAGSTGAYLLTLTAGPASLPGGPLPAVLAADADGALAPDGAQFVIGQQGDPGPSTPLEPLHGSPLALHIALDGPVDPNAFGPADIRLVGSDNQDVPLQPVGFDPATNELLVTPAAPLAPGYYDLALTGAQVAPASVFFQVDGVEGVVGATTADDTVAGAHPLGNVIGNRVQVAGVIGDDPTDPLPFNPSDVDLYHFQLTGPGPFAFTAEVFAGRIGSPLEPCLTLFRRDATGQFVFVASNPNTGNATPATDGSFPLMFDDALFAGLPAGDYYLAVSSGFDYVDPDAGLVSGPGGVLTPGETHTGNFGNTTGRYVLQVRAETVTQVPHVTFTSADSGTFTGPPEHLSVGFDEPVNLQQLAYTAYVHSFQSLVSSVFIQADDGTQYFPRLESYDAGSHEATFLLLDALPAGSYSLHLSGPLWLTDMAGDPLAGNDPSGDYVVPFKVLPTPRGTPGNPTLWQSQAAASPDQPQVLGTLFPAELASGVTVLRDPAGERPAGQTSDYYQFTVLQEQDYGVSIAPTGDLTMLPQVTVWQNGVALKGLPVGDGAVLVHLKPGTYTVEVNWQGADPASVSYQLSLTLAGNDEPATTLTTGPAPVLRLQLVADDPPASSPLATPTPTPAPPVVSVPAPEPASPGGSLGSVPVVVETAPVTSSSPTGPAAGREVPAVFVRSLETPTTAPVTPAIFTGATADPAVPRPASPPVVDIFRALAVGALGSERVSPGSDGASVLRLDLSTPSGRPLTGLLALSIHASNLDGTGDTTVRAWLPADLAALGSLAGQGLVPATAAMVDVLRGMSRGLEAVDALFSLRLPPGAEPVEQDVPVPETVAAPAPAEVQTTEAEVIPPPGAPGVVGRLGSWTALALTVLLGLLGSARWRRAPAAPRPALRRTPGDEDIRVVTV